MQLLPLREAPSRLSSGEGTKCQERHLRGRQEVRLKCPQLWSEVASPHSTTHAQHHSGLCRHRNGTVVTGTVAQATGWTQKGILPRRSRISPKLPTPGGLEVTASFRLVISREGCISHLPLWNRPAGTCSCRVKIGTRQGNLSILPHTFQGWCSRPGP